MNEDAKHSRVIHIELPTGLSEARRILLGQVACAYDRALGDLESDPTLIFPSDADRLRRFYASRSSWSRRWSKPTSCMQPNCTAKSISRSHSIAMAASLKQIAEDGHLVAPAFSGSRVEVLPIGVHEASTFPGFCAAHEAQFEGFESQKKISTAKHFYLQAFRTLCREIYCQRHHRETLQERLEEYRKLRDVFITGRLRAVRGAESFECTLTDSGSDPVERWMTEKMRCCQRIWLN